MLTANSYMSEYKQDTRFQLFQHDVITVTVAFAVLLMAEFPPIRLVFHILHEICECLKIKVHI